MRTMKRFVVASVAFLLIASLYSCAKPPTAEVEAARAAVSAAEQDKAVVAYAGDSLKRAKDALDRMQTELDAKKYDAAKASAQEAVQAAEKAVADGKTGMERAKATAGDLLNTVKVALAEAQAAIAAAKGKKGVKLDFASLENELTAASSSIDAADADYAAGDYKASIEKAQAAQTKIGNIVGIVSEAARAASKKK